ncbi:Uncharacterised protein (plasmid) [Legionella adelaidensis]|uniref:Transmembrane protein n=2 Tax=Legionella adelaidensis TaxID=45056 RepID=A0A0W0R669_9GAMM|nr:hypothetical protein Lade_1226 [Legionella adelaidensis]VEH85478.1 Uncharacterised protein [Legionella adelaidensis]
MVIYALVIIFILPGLLAHYFFHHPDFLKNNKTNKGELVIPPVKLSLIEKTNFSQGKDHSISFAEGKKWKLLLWEPSVCDTDCYNQLDRLSRIRLALGRKLYHVDVGLLGKADKISEKLQSVFKSLDLHYLISSNREHLTNATRILLVDPNDYMVIAFKKDASSKDIFHDLKKLVNTKEQAM